MARDELAKEMERSLARLGAATEELVPTDQLGDDVMKTIANLQSPDDRLAEIARATRSLDPDAALTGAVMSRVRENRPARQKQPMWLDGVVRSGPVAIGLAVLAAAASFVIFSTSQSDLDVTVASAVDMVEVDE